MKIVEFIEKNNETESVNLKEMLEIRAYIPIVEKKAILEDILDRCFVVEDGVLICDYVLQITAFELAMIKYHTNLEIDIASEEDYDTLWGVKESLYELYAKDYEDCRILFEGMKKELCAQYSLESSLVTFINNISGSIEGLVEKISQKVEGFDIGFEGKELSQFKSLLNKYGNKV